MLLINDRNYSVLHFNQKALIIEKVCKLKTKETLALIKTRQPLRRHFNGSGTSLTAAKGNVKFSSGR